MLNEAMCIILHLHPQVYIRINNIATTNHVYTTRQHLASSVMAAPLAVPSEQLCIMVLPNMHGNLRFDLQFDQ